MRLASFSDDGANAGGSSLNGGLRQTNPGMFTHRSRNHCLGGSLTRGAVDRLAVDRLAVDLLGGMFSQRVPNAIDFLAHEKDTRIALVQATDNSHHHFT